MIRSLRIVSVAVMACLLAGCPPDGAVWIRSGSTPGHIVFGISLQRDGPPVPGFRGLRVGSCHDDGAGNDAFWLLSPTGEAKPIGSVVYAEVPAGYRSDQGPRPLAPGCYHVKSFNGGKAEFVITEGGTLTERKTW